MLASLNKAYNNNKGEKSHTVDDSVCTSAIKKSEDPDSAVFSFSVFFSLSYITSTYSLYFGFLVSSRMVLRLISNKKKAFTNWQHTTADNSNMTADAILEVGNT